MLVSSILGLQSGDGLRVIILNEDKFYASLLGSATKKLGHSPSVLTTVESAMSKIVAEGADAILIDLESQGSAGIEFAFELHRKGLHVLVGFCTGTCKVEELLAMAKNLGPILPKVWTHNDLRTILKEFQHQLNSQVIPPSNRADTELSMDPSITLPLTRIQLAEKEIAELEKSKTALGTGQIPAFQSKELQLAEPTMAGGTGARAPKQSQVSKTLDLDLVNIDCDSTKTMSAQAIDMQIAIIEDEPATVITKTIASPKTALQAVSIVCKAWGQLERLCHDMERGKKTITVRSKNDMDIGQEVEVSLELPDASIVPIVASILRAQPARTDGFRPYQLELTGLNDGQIQYLMGRVKQAMPQPSPDKAVKFRAPTVRIAHTIETTLPPVRQAKGTAAKKPPTRAERMPTVQYPIGQTIDFPAQEPVQKAKAPIRKTESMPALSPPKQKAKATQSPVRRGKAVPTQPPPSRRAKTASTQPPPTRRAVPTQPPLAQKAKAISTHPVPARRAVPTQPPPAQKAKAISTHPVPARRAKAISTHPAPARRAVSTQPPPGQRAKAISTHPAPARRAVPTQPPPVQRAAVPTPDSFDTPPHIRSAPQPLPTPASIPSSRDALTPAPYEDDVKISWGKPGS